MLWMTCSNAGLKGDTLAIPEELEDMAFGPLRHILLRNIYDGLVNIPGTHSAIPSIHNEKA